MTVRNHERRSPCRPSAASRSNDSTPLAAEILTNIVAMAEILHSRDAAVPDVPYVELAKCVRVTSL